MNQTIRYCGASLYCAQLLNSVGNKVKLLKNLLYILLTVICDSMLSFNHSLSSVYIEFVYALCTLDLLRTCLALIT